MREKKKQKEKKNNEKSRKQDIKTGAKGSVKILANTHFGVKKRKNQESFLFLA